MPPRSVEEFEQQYAERSGVTVAFLHEYGRYGERCNCGEEGCQGFQMTNAWEDALMEDRAREVGADLGYFSLPYFRDASSS